MALLASTGPVAAVEAEQKKETEEFETDPKRLIARAKQIEYGKATLGYQHYLAAVPREQRKKYGKDMHPRTPDVTQKQSKRQWDGMLKAWRCSLHKYDCLEGSTADVSAPDAARDLLPFATTPEPTSPGAPFTSIPPSISTDNPSPKDAPPSSRKASFKLHKDQASVSSKIDARLFKTALKRLPLRDSTNGQNSESQHWGPKVGKNRSDQSTKPAGDNQSSGCSPSDPEVGALSYRGSRSKLVAPGYSSIGASGASTRAAPTSGDLCLSSETIMHAPALKQSIPFKAAMGFRPAAISTYMPPHQRHAGRLFKGLVAASYAPGAVFLKTDKLPAHVALMIHRRNAAYAVATATAPSMAVGPTSSTAKTTVSCNGNCLVCKEAESTVMLLPCKHWSLCRGCSHQYLLAVGASASAACTSLGRCPACWKHAKQHVSIV